MGKKQIGWRKSDADENLYLVQHGQTQKEWTLFVDQIFQQDGFIGSEASVASIQTQWKKRIEEHKNMFGLESGHPTNLSDLAGDMSELDCIIRYVISTILRNAIIIQCTDKYLFVGTLSPKKRSSKQEKRLPKKTRRRKTKLNKR
jgi:hypothetical protein